MNNMHILGFSGSLRQSSYNRALLRAAQELLPEDVTLELFDLDPIPLYNGDVEARGFPEAVVAFKERIAAADALLIAAPEYNYSMPGVLKKHDWASRAGCVTNGKPVALMASVNLLGTAPVCCIRCACSQTCCR